MELEGCWCELGVRAAELWNQPFLEPSGTKCMESVMTATCPVPCGTSPSRSLNGAGLHQTAPQKLELRVLFLQALSCPCCQCSVPPG